MLNIIAYHCRLSLQLLNFFPLLCFNNRKHLKYTSHCLSLLTALILPATSLTYAGDDNGQKIKTIPPVTILLNKPNYLDECLTALREESVITLHDFLISMLHLERNNNRSSYPHAFPLFYDKDQFAKFYSLYHVLSIRYYQGPSFTGFMDYMIYNKPAKMFKRPLMKAMLKLCYYYIINSDITIGNMLDEVEKQKHTDENINAFLCYKANSVKSQCNALYTYSDNDTYTSHNSTNSIPESFQLDDGVILQEKDPQDYTPKNWYFYDDLLDLDCDPDAITAALAVTGAITCVTYATMLFENRHTKNTLGTCAWLLSPITKTARYLRGYRDCNMDCTENEDKNKQL
ncbi:MAG: hypothetical protein QS721_06965 [Candidatus Endonucleobacter sp. (ex Gigantidas childressi)]|nr:hypothetical protein [Candidatus Endonucleobacter sp. (ex Gigantidas childressi)]